MANGDVETALLIESPSDSPPPGPPPVSVPSKNKSKTDPSASDFAFIKIIARLTLQLVRRFWAFSSAAALAIILFYWLCGGIVAFGLVAFALTGTFLKFFDNTRQNKYLLNKFRGKN